MPRRPPKSPSTATTSRRIWPSSGSTAGTIYLGKHGSPESRESTTALLAEWLATGRARPPPPATDGPRVERPDRRPRLILAFWRHAQEHYRGPDGTPIRGAGQPQGRPPAGPQALRPDSGARVRPAGPASRPRGDGRASGLARTSVNARVNRIRRAFRWAASVELVPASVVQALGTVAGLQKGRTDAREARPIGPVPIERVEATLPHLPRPVAGDGPAPAPDRDAAGRGVRDAGPRPDAGRAGLDIRARARTRPPGGADAG